MKLGKRQIILEEYEFYKGNLKVIFNLGGDKYIEDIIDEYTFQKYIQKSDKLQYIEDCWDGYRESHYTKEILIDYDEWKNNECVNDDIIEFLYYYYKNNKIPHYLEL